MQVNLPKEIRVGNRRIAAEIEIPKGYNPGNSPVVPVTITMLTGDIDNADVLFDGALQVAYQTAITVSGIQKDNNDLVQLEILHQGIKSHNGTFNTSTYPITDHVVDDLVDDWEKVLQSDTSVNLSEGSLTLRFTFTLLKFRPRGQRRMGQGNKRMYVRTIYDKFYTSTNSLKKIPDVVDGWCFPMSFLSCQRRRLILNDQKEIIKIKESNASTKRETDRKKIPINNETLYEYIPLSSQEDIEMIRTYLPHYYAESGGIFTRQYFLVVFNPYKIPDHSQFGGVGVESYVLDECHSPAQLNAWVRAAQILHSYVEGQCFCRINKNDVAECMQAYANTFQIHIHVLRVAAQLQRTEFFIPESINESKHLDHLYVVFGDANGNEEHCHAVTNRRKMIRREQRVNDISLANYCDFCYQSKDNSNQSANDGMKHITKCYSCFQVENQQTVSSFDVKKYHEMVSSETCNSPFGKTRFGMYKCTICSEEMDKNQIPHHQCYMPLPKTIPAKPIPDLTNEMETPNYWVYDIESSQKRTNTSDIRFEHIPNCICFMPVYPQGEEDKYHFYDIQSFCEFILSEKRLEGATIFAHNGGSYDHQFIIQYMEKNCLSYQTMPRPGSSHKYLDVILKRGDKDETNIHLKDFIVFMPQSLKAIAQSFDLEIQKGDFPHTFNNGENDNYIGPLPSIEYYGLNNTKSEKEYNEFSQWYISQKEIYCTCEICHCTKKKWNFQEEIQKYCWDDTIILAKSIQLYRKEHISFGDDCLENSNEWQPTSIDPLNYLTQAGAAIQYFLQGHAKSKKKMTAGVSKPRVRSGFSDIGIIWLEEKSRELGFHIQHAGNSLREYFDSFATYSYVDGYGVDSNGKTHIFEFLGCYWHSCPICFGDCQEYNTKHSTRNISTKLIYEKTIEKIEKLKQHYNYVHTIWEHEYKSKDQCSLYEKELCHVIKGREMFFGGRTEVFSPYAKPTEGKINYHDVCSMYPFVCASKMLPIGHPTIIFGHEIQFDRLHQNHPDSYFGYVRCRVIPNENCVLGLLPEHKDGKLQFNLLEKTGVWFTAEIYLAMSVGYRVTEIYEVFHFDAHNRSDQFFRGYMSFFMRIKQESEGWKKLGASSDNPSEEEKIQVQQKLYEDNHGLVAKIRFECVRKNPVRRQLAKLNLNCLWGKFAQCDEGRVNQKILCSYEDWSKQLFNNVKVDRKSIRYREMNGGYYMAYYKTVSEHEKVNKFVNIYLASAVTAWARTILHTQMLKVGPEKLLYCDTDSIVFLQDATETRIFTSVGLGNWEDEIDKEDQIVEFLALAPKTYMVITKNKDASIKAKGVRMTYVNQQKTTKDILRKILEEAFVYKSLTEPATSLLLDHMTIYSNSVDSKFDYATVFTRYAQKKVKAVISKRTPVPFPRNSNARIMNGDIERLFLAPFSSRSIEENSNYSHVYDKYCFSIDS